MKTCISCKAPVLWAHTRDGLPVPLDPKAVAINPERRGKGEIAGFRDDMFFLCGMPATKSEISRGAYVVVRVSHFLTCPQNKPNRREVTP